MNINLQKVLGKIKNDDDEKLLLFHTPHAVKTSVRLPPWFRCSHK